MGVQIVFYPSTHQQFGNKKPAFFCLQIHNTLIYLDEDIPKYIFMQFQSLEF